MSDLVIAQLVERRTVEVTDYPSVTGSIPVREICFCLFIAHFDGYNLQRFSSKSTDHASCQSHFLDSTLSTP